MIDAFTMQPHFLWHIAPVFLALPDSLRGHVYVDTGLPECQAIGERTGLHPYLRPGRVPYRGTPEPVLIAGGSEAWGASTRPIILIEHGAGQSYTGMDSAAYSGGIGRDGVRLFLCPNEQVAARNRGRYPAARSVAVGAPHLDLKWKRTVPHDGPIAVTFHHDYRGIPETRNAWRHYADAILNLDRRWRLLGHAHPRAQWEILPWWADHGIEAAPHLVDVFARARLLIVDNSSAGMEFAALDRPIVWLNAPWYRRDVHHGGRFWEWTEMAVTIDGPGQLEDAVELALLDPPAIRDARREWVARTYAAFGGDAAARAVAEVLPFVV